MQQDGQSRLTRDYSGFDGPTPEEERRAFAALHRRRYLHCPSQGSNAKFVGTPRHAKHGSGRIEGVRVR